MGFIRGAEVAAEKLIERSIFATVDVTGAEARTHLMGFIGVRVKTLTYQPCPFYEAILLVSGRDFPQPLKKGRFRLFWGLYDS